eukprot:TRINITY_DN2445_c0_g4_i1.p1 TRINITY_DN2445_c0_g4~~TRINITY_DN2445_c0_g4_i1.p1  ORF type:complete len:143 (-),score=25.41 TRINITY_DN2445_c0_g4_i1:127-555(-)
MPDLASEMMKRAKQPEIAQAAIDMLRGQEKLPKLEPLVLRIPRPPTGSNAPHSNFVYDLVLPYLLAYLECGQQSDVSLSADPFVAFPQAMFLVSKGYKVVRETDEAMAKRNVGQRLTFNNPSQTQEEVTKWLEQVSGPRSKL